MESPSSHKVPTMAVPSHGAVAAHFITFLSRYHRALWTVILYAATLGLLGLVTPVAVQALVNSAAFGTLLQPLLVLTLLVLAVLVVMGIIKGLKTYAVEVLQRRMFADGVARLAYVFPKRMAEPSSTDLTHRYFELFTLQKAASSLLLGAVDAVLAALVGLLVLGFYHPYLLAFDAALVVAMGITVLGLGRGGVTTALEESQAKYALASFLADVEQAPTTYRHRTGEAHAHRELDGLCGEYLSARSNHFRVVFRQLAGALTTQALASAVVLGLGGYLVVARELTLGQLVSAELIVTAVVSAISDLGKHFETYYDLVVSVHKLDYALDLPTERELEVTRPAALVHGPLRLELKDVSLRAGSAALLTHANLRLAAGSRCQLSGRSGSGKTLLLQTLYGMGSTERGAITLSGIDLRDITPGELRERVAVVLGPELMPGSILQNVGMGRTDLGVGEVRALLDALGLTEELSHLPEGLDTRVGKGGLPLSHSQALRITVARAILQKPGLLAIDSDLLGMDNAALDITLGELARDEAPWTLLLVGDHPALAKHTQLHVRIANGTLQSGAHP
jgi:ABC-type bacteriocin/lantibiotic exporter with double-glycine peptidase domain